MCLLQSALLQLFEILIAPLLSTLNVIGNWNNIPNAFKILIICSISCTQQYIAIMLASVTDSTTIFYITIFIVIGDSSKKVENHWHCAWWLDTFHSQN